MTKILILHTSVGHGIKVTAQNIYARLVKSGRFEVRIEDFQEIERGAFAIVLEKMYLFFTERFSFIWGWLYSDLAASIIIPLRPFMAALKYRKTLRMIQSFQPNIIISTETAPTGIVAYLKTKGLYKGKLAVAFSDYHLHRFWLYDQVDLYLCNIAEQAIELTKLGVAPDRLAVTGMVVSEKYLQKVSREEAAKKFALDPRKKTILISGGRRGLQASKEITEKLLESLQPFQIAVVTGKNEELKKQLELLDPVPEHFLKILGYVTDQDVLMSAADVLISKPGGPTIAEAVSKGLPIVVTDAHPGHEMRNMEYLERHNAALSGRNPAEVVKLVEMILRREVKHDKAGAFEKIIRPKEAISLTDVLSRFNMNL